MVEEQEEDWALRARSDGARRDAVRKVLVVLLLLPLRMAAAVVDE